MPSSGEFPKCHSGDGMPWRRLCKRNVVWYNTAISDQPSAISHDNASDPDHALMRRVAQGDEAAFTELIGKYKLPVHSFVFRMLGDADEAEDVAQEAFITVYRTADLYAPRAKCTTRLFAIAKHRATDRLRHRQRRPTVSREEAEARLKASADRGDNPSQALGREELAAAVQRGIEQLPSDQKTALILYEYQDLSYAEIAEVMRCS